MYEFFSFQITLFLQFLKSWMLVVFLNLQTPAVQIKVNIVRTYYESANIIFPTKIEINLKVWMFFFSLFALSMQYFCLIWEDKRFLRYS